MRARGAIISCCAETEGGGGNALWGVIMNSGASACTLITSFSERTNILTRRRPAFLEPQHSSRVSTPHCFSCQSWVTLGAGWFGVGLVEVQTSLLVSPADGGPPVGCSAGPVRVLHGCSGVQLNITCSVSVGYGVGGSFIHATKYDLAGLATVGLALG